MLKNNGKMIVGRNFLFCLCIICLMFTAFGLCSEHSCAVDLNDTVGEMDLESNDVNVLENSQSNEIMEVNSEDSQNLFSNTYTPTGNIYKSIQDKVDAAKPGDTILLKGTYHSNGKDQIVINKKLTITSYDTAILDGKHLSTAFLVNEAGAGTVFRNLKFINGEGDIGSAVIIHSKNVRVENCIFEDNHANRGGAVNTRYDLNIPSGVIVDSCQFRRNTGYYKNFEQFSCGAALALYGHDSEVKNCIFEDNWVKSQLASYGGAIQIGMDEPGSNAKVTNCIFRNNRAISISQSSHGGAGCVRDGTSYTNCLFSNNYADEGGALTFHASGEIKNCTFLDNSARYYGGALSTGFLYEYMELTVNGCNFYGNTAPRGGAIQANGLNVIIKDSNFKNNNVTQNGGAIHVNAEDVTVKNSIFNSNVANIDGGAVYIKGKNTVIDNSTFLSNEATPDVNKMDDGLGGAIYVDSSQALIKNNIFRFNTARNGSAIYYDESGKQLTLEDNELFQNQAWVYQLPIHTEDIYYEDCEKIRVVLYGGNNIADFDNLAVSNAIYNDAENVNIVIDGEYPLYGARNTGELYQDGREYNINILLTVQHEDGTLVYNEVGHTNYLGEIAVDLDNLKPGKYFVSAKHYEDNYYKAIVNATTFIVNPKVDNEIKKSVSKDVVNFEDVVTWTITVTNHGPNDATDVKVYDVLADGLILINTTADDKYDSENGILKIGDLKINETFTFQMVTVVNSTGIIVNKANITSNEFDFDLNNNHDERSIFVNPASDLSVVKTVSNNSPNYKDTIVWTIEITNNGPDTAHNVTMIDVLPKSLIYVGCDNQYSYDSGIWNVGTLQNGEKATVNIECIVNSTGLIENSVSVNATEYDCDETNNHNVEFIVVSPASDLSIVKSVNSSNVNFNDLVKWTLTVSNNGPDKATNIRIIDLLPDGFTYVDSILTKGNYSDDIFTVESLEVGEKIIIEIITLIEDTGNFTNIANVSSDNYDFNLTNNENNESIFVNPASDLSVTKYVSDSNPNFGDIITWTVEIVNNGPDTAHQIVIKDLLPDSLIWIGDDSLMDYNPISGELFIDELGVEESYTLNIECRVNGTGLIKNIVSVTAVEYDFNLTNNQYNETIDVEKAADVSMIKSVDNLSPNYNDLVKWTLIISNNGPDKATNIFVEDQLPEGLVFVNYTATRGFYDNGIWVMCCLNNGDCETLEILCRVNKTGKLVNLASIHADEHDYNESNNNDSQSIDVPLAVDLQVEIGADKLDYLFGDEINWMISVKNNGPDNATGVVLEDILPNGLIFTGYKSSNGIYGDNIWNIGSLNVGDVVYLNITTIADELGEIVNDVEVESAQYDWNLSNNKDSKLINVMPVANLAVEKSVDKIHPKYGELVRWTLTVSNHGPNDAHNVVIKDIIPMGLKFVSSNGDYSDNLWKIGCLKVGEVQSLEIICRVTSTGDIVNAVDIWSDEVDKDKSDNHAERSIHVGPASDLAVTKIASSYSYHVGDVIEYVIEITNNGPDTAHNIKIREILDDLLKLKSFKTTKGKFNKFDNVWTINSLGYGESAKLFIKVVAVGSGIIKNSVQVSSDTFDYDLSNNKDFAVVNVTENPSNELSSCMENGLGGYLPTDLEMHPTANPIAVLFLSLMYSAVFLANNISKKN